MSQGQRGDLSRTVVCGRGPAPRRTFALAVGVGGHISQPMPLPAGREESVAVVAQARWGRVDMGLLARVRESSPIRWGRGGETGLRFPGKPEQG